MGQARIRRTQSETGSAPTIAATPRPIEVSPEAIIGSLQSEIGALVGQVHILRARLQATELALQAEQQKTAALIADQPKSGAIL